MSSFFVLRSYGYHSSNYFNSNSCRSCTLLKAIAQSAENLTVVSSKSKSENYCYCDSLKSDNFGENQEKKQRTDTKN